MIINEFIVFILKGKLSFMVFILKLAFGINRLKTDFFDFIENPVEYSMGFLSPLF